MKIIGRHKWVEGATITESYDETDDTKRRFTATIRGFRNWKIYEGKLQDDTTGFVRLKVIHLRDRIDANDEAVFLFNEFARQ